MAPLLAWPILSQLAHQALHSRQTLHRIIVAQPLEQNQPPILPRTLPRLRVRRSQHPGLGQPYFEDLCVEKAAAWALVSLRAHLNVYSGKHRLRRPTGSGG